MRLALKRLREYQGERYAKLYERRMQPFLDGEAGSPPKWRAISRSGWRTRTSSASPT
jgi:hypothetical protein